MKKNFYLLLIIIATFLLQSTFGSLLPDSFTKPNMLLILTVSMGFMRGKKSGLRVGFICGILVDLLYGEIFGLTALLYMYIGYVNGFLFKRFFEEDIRVPMISVGICDFLYNLGVFAAGFVVRNRLKLGSYMMNTILPEMVCSILFAIPLYGIYYWLNRRITAVELEEEQSPWLRR